ncbi:hypothetical protein S83_041259 [Arachis hypogaea]
MFGFCSMSKSLSFENFAPSSPQLHVPLFLSPYPKTFLSILFTFPTHTYINNNTFYVSHHYPFSVLSHLGLFQALDPSHLTLSSGLSHTPKKLSFLSSFRL